MKKLIFLIIITIFSSQVIGQTSGMKFFDGKWKSLLKQAKKKDKIIFVDAYASWCGPCKYMSKNIFTNDKVGEFFNKNFVNYKMDMEKDEGVEIKKKYNVSVYPTYLFLNSDGEIVHRAVGSMPAKDFIKLGETTLDPEQNLAGYNKRYEKGDRNPKFLYEYAMICRDARTDYKAVSIEYFNTQEEVTLTSENNWKAINKLTDDIKSREFIFLVGNQASFAEKYGVEAVDKKIENIIRNAVFATYREKKDIDIEELSRNTIEHLPLENPEKMYLKIKMIYYQYMKKDWENYAEVAIYYVESFAMTNTTSREINEIAWNFYINIESNEYLNHAIKWVMHGMEIDDNYAIHDTYASLLYKMGNTDDALRIALEAIDMAKRSEQSYSGTEKLIEKIKTGER